MRAEQPRRRQHVVLGVKRSRPIGGWDGFSPQSGAPLDVAGACGAVAITGGYSHTCALMNSPHAAKCWGYGSEGQLGNGENRTSYAPVDVNGL
jgi:hypothetical protein